MYVVKVLKRKDASSVILAVVVAMFVLQFVTSVTLELASRVALWQWDKATANNPGFYPSGGWQTTYLTPLVALILELLVLEVLVWVYVWLHSAFSKK